MRHSPGLDKRGGVGNIVIFIITCTIIIVIIMGMQSMTSTNLFKFHMSDSESSASIVKEAIINSPACLLHTEKKEIGGEEILDYKKGVIGWERVWAGSNDCVMKGGYLYYVTVNDLDDGTVREFGNICGSKMPGVDSTSSTEYCKKKGMYPYYEEDMSAWENEWETQIVNFGMTRSPIEIHMEMMGTGSEERMGELWGELTRGESLWKFGSFCGKLVRTEETPVLIYKEGELHNGEVITKIYTKDFIVDIDNQPPIETLPYKKAFKVTITNLGDCMSDYIYKVYIIDKDGNKYFLGGDPLHVNGVQGGKKSAVSYFRVKDHELTSEEFVGVEAWPYDIPAFKRIAQVKYKKSG